MDAVGPDHDGSALDGPVRAVDGDPVRGDVDAHDALPHVNARLGLFGQAAVQRRDVVRAVHDADAVSVAFFRMVSR